jgi:hypothetical protein
LTALPAQPPNGVNVPGSGIPGASGTGETEQQIDPMRVAGTGSLSEIIPLEYEQADEEYKKKILSFSGGRGVSQTATREMQGKFISTPVTAPSFQRK